MYQLFNVSFLIVPYMWNYCLPTVTKSILLYSLHSHVDEYVYTGCKRQRFLFLLPYLISLCNDSVIFSINLPFLHSYFTNLLTINGHIFLVYKNYFFEF